MQALVFEIEHRASMNKYAKHLSHMKPTGKVRGAMKNPKPMTKGKH